MLSFHDVWSKGQAMLSVGLQKKLLHGSIAMELSKDPTKRADQIKKNPQMVKDANGHFDVPCVLFLFCFQLDILPRFLIIVRQPHVFP